MDELPNEVDAPDEWEIPATQGRSPMKWGSGAAGGKKSTPPMKTKSPTKSPKATPMKIKSPTKKASPAKPTSPAKKSPAKSPKESTTPTRASASRATSSGGKSESPKSAKSKKSSDGKLVPMKRGSPKESPSRVLVERASAWMARSREDAEQEVHDKNNQKKKRKEDAKILTDSLWATLGVAENDWTALALKLNPAYICEVPGEKETWKSFVSRRLSGLSKVR
jgi:hypothetical protein